MSTTMDIVLHKPGVDSEEIHVTGTGALTSGDLPPIWQVASSLVESAARRLKKGNDKGYDIHNWRKGLADPVFLRDRFNHGVVHLLRFGAGDTRFDTAQENLDAVTWLVMMLNEAMRLHPEAVAKAFYAEPRGEKTTTVEVPF